MGSTNFVSSLWLPDIQIFKCKQFKKRQIVTDVAGPPTVILFHSNQPQQVGEETLQREEE